MFDRGIMYDQGKLRPANANLFVFESKFFETQKILSYLSIYNNTELYVPPSISIPSMPGLSTLFRSSGILTFNGPDFSFLKKEFATPTSSIGKTFDFIYFHNIFNHVDKNSDLDIAIATKHMYDSEQIFCYGDCQVSSCTMEYNFDDKKPESTFKVMFNKLKRYG